MNNTNKMYLYETPENYNEIKLNCCEQSKYRITHNNVQFHSMCVCIFYFVFPFCLILFCDIGSIPIYVEEGYFMKVPLPVATFVTFYLSSLSGHLMERQVAEVRLNLSNWNRLVLHKQEETNSKGKFGFYCLLNSTRIML